MKRPTAKITWDLFALSLIVAIPIWYFSVPNTIRFGMQAWKVWELQGWEEVPAELEKAELVSRPVNLQDDKNVPVEDMILKVRYRYLYAQKEYVGRNLGIHYDYPSLLAINQHLLNQLTPFLQQGKPFRCFVNPQRPEEAVLFRRVGWGFASLLIFTCLVPTFLMLVFVLSAYFHMLDNRRLNVLVEEYPDKPWMWRLDWAIGEISSPQSTKRNRSRGRMIHSCLCYLTVLLMLLFCLSILMMVLENGEEGEHTVLVITLAVFGGLSSGVMAFLRYLSWKAGVSRFTLANNPGEIGGYLEGTVETRSGLISPAGVNVMLYCRESVGDRVKRIWSDSQDVVPVEQSDHQGRVKIPIEFAIPADQPATYWGQGKKYKWVLTISDKVKKIAKFRSSFEVPVFDLGKGTKPDSDKSTREQSQKEEEHGLYVYEMIFGMVSLGIAVLMWFWGGVDLIRYWEMNSWEEESSRILICGRVAHGANGNGVRTFVEYEYQYQGETYTGKNVSLYMTAARGKVQEGRFKELREYHRSGKSFRCYVNPRNPQISVLYREMTLPHLLLLVLFLFPCIAYFGYYGIRLNYSGYRNFRKFRSKRRTSDGMVSLL